MKLNEQSKNELRKEIEEAVKRVPEGQRIELPLDLLDDLIFLKIKNKKGVTVKFPIWTGKFLRKIDLSKLSFENVFLCSDIYEFIEYGDLENYFDIYKLINFNINDHAGICVPPFIKDGKVNNSEDILLNPNYHIIDFSYTNCNIDLSKVYGNIISDVNLEGVNLSKSNNSKINSFKFCNLSKTNINIDFNNNELLENIINCNLSFNNYENQSVDFENLFSSVFSVNWEPSNFSNTGLNIIYNHKNIPHEVKENEIKYHELCKKSNETGLSIYELDSNADNIIRLYRQYNEVFNAHYILRDVIKKGLLRGCYINGKSVLDKNHSFFNKEELIEEYENMKKDIFDSTLGSIEEQIKGFKGK